jgi:hypothetical protein
MRRPQGRFRDDRDLIFPAGAPAPASPTATARTVDDGAWLVQ